jgi:hypothetical protein
MQQDRELAGEGEWQISADHAQPSLGPAGGRVPP